MNLIGNQRSRLEEALSIAFTQPELDQFLQNHLDKRLDHIAIGHNLKIICGLVVSHYLKNGKIYLLCKKFVAHVTNPDLLAISNDILANEPKVAPSGEVDKPHMVGDRPVLNRLNLWERLHEIYAGEPSSRVLIIDGEAASGKTYSQWLISHFCLAVNDGRPPVFIDLKYDIDAADISGVKLANQIFDDLRLGTPQARFDDLAQPTQKVKSSAKELISCLRDLETHTWLIIDHLNNIRVDKTAIDLLVRLCGLIQRGETPYFHLILIGLDLNQVDPAFAMFLPRDEATRPSRQDIKDYLDWVVKDACLTPGAGVIDIMADHLDASLPHTPSHSEWYEFHKELKAKCRTI